jgi:hypothetical protein
VRPGQKPLSTLRARFWRDKGLTWAAVGRVLAQEDGRRVAYCGRAVQKAVAARRPLTPRP